jgi:hypothetical protein
MRAAWIAAALVLLMSAAGREPAFAQTASGSSQARATEATSAHAQSTRRRPAARTRITVYPRRRAASLYPSPYPYDYPGPGAVRDCTSWLEQEARPSGTVIVPRMRCAWRLP